MARPQKITDGIEASGEPTVEPVTETITYLPGNGDPATNKCCGHVFQANVPKEITGHPDGTPSQKLNMHLIEMVRPKAKPDGSMWHHPNFTIGDGARTKRHPTALPTTADQYRAYAVGWLKDPSIQHADQLIARFAKDRELHAACEVGTDDFAWLATLFMPKLHELAQGDELTGPQVSTIWISHGFNVLPW
jgi:hypothetical protein